jgi:hypothetical protein
MTRGLKSIPWWIWLIPTVLLLVATAHLPYGYYTFTRIVVCGCAGWFAVASFYEQQVLRIWSAVFGLTAILFNPIVPIFLKRGTWLYIDIFIAILFLSHLILCRLRQRRP